MALTPDHKATWLTALRSGDYKQGNGFLYREDTDTYCCLGVDVKTRGAEFNDTGTYCVLGDIRLASNSQAEELTVIYDGELDQKDIYRLMGMNDGGIPFSEIAYWIEQNL